MSHNRLRSRHRQIRCRAGETAPTRNPRTIKAILYLSTVDFTICQKSPSAASILAEENRPFRLHAIRTEQDGAAAKSTPAKNFGLSDSSK
jgi:hypothetical protein